MGFNTVRLFNSLLYGNIVSELMYPFTTIFVWLISSVVFYESGNIDKYSKEFLALAAYENLSIEERKFLKSLRSSHVKVGSSFPITLSDVLYYSSTEIQNIVNLLVGIPK